MIRVVVDQAAVDAAHHTTAQTAHDGTAQHTEDSADDEPRPLTDTGLALLPGAKIIPTAVLAEAIRNGATIVPLHLPGPDGEPGYRPSAALAEYVRIRDLFCRFPGCSVPADHCDIDHSVPWPHGPTHPSKPELQMPRPPGVEDSARGVTSPLKTQS